VQPLPLSRTREEIRVDPARGLSSEEVASLASRYGPNILAPEAARSRWRRLLRPLTDPMVVILIFAGSLFIGLGETFDGSTMLLATLPLIVVDLILEARAESTLDRLREMASPRVLVRRDGREMLIPATRLVPGDVVLLKEGDVVPADGVVQSESGLQVDESALTGESLPVAKLSAGWPPLSQIDLRETTVFAGTIVLAGRATVVVTATGPRTEFGRVGALVAQARPRATPFERSVQRLVRVLSVVAVAASLAVAAIVLVRGTALVEALLAGVSLAIAAIPEEFPIMFAIYLTVGAWRMAKRNALIRHLPSVETLGSATVICTDKTGTLTEGRLAVRALQMDGRVQIIDTPAAARGMERLLEDALLASEPQPFDPLDQAIGTLAASQGMDPPVVYSRWSMVQDYPFDPVKKYVSHVWRSRRGETRLAAKGSLEGLLELVHPEDPARERVAEAHRQLANMGMRVVAVAEKSLEKVSSERWANEAGIRLVGLVGFADPLRPGVRRAIAECQSAGVKVVMITGDHPLTAHAIAEAAGLRHDDERIVTGEMLEAMDEDALRRTLPMAAIFARVRPAQKLRIVQGFKALGQVVAMTGDGINDAPALRTADIGVAMGRRGTQVAREAANMVLLDDNFGTIVDAIMEGRRAFDNLQRSFVYLIVFHFPIVLGALLIPMLGAPLLLLPTTMVWLEIIVHPTAALVFAADPPDPDIMKRPPRRPSDPFFPPGTLRWMLTEGAAMAASVLALYMGLLSFGVPASQARGAAIACLLVGQTLVVLQSRSTRLPFWSLGLLDNRVLLPALLATLASLGVFLLVGPLASATQIEAPSPLQWTSAVVLAVLSTLALEPLKLRWR